MRTRLNGDFLMEQWLEKMKERNLDHKDAFEQMLSLIFWNTTQIENCVSRTLATNMEICQLLADMRGSKSCVQDNKFIKLHINNQIILLYSHQSTCQNILTSGNQKTTFPVLSTVICGGN